MRGWTRLLPLVVTLLSFADRALADPRYYDDATLRAVYFIDDKEGWAAGDEGVIWHTLDGGNTWARQPTGVRASLRGLCFQSAEVGWAVGREELPHGGSAGVLLFTRDGGLKWQRLLTGALPGLNQVRFVDQANGFLLGDGAEALPSGLFRTTDGGRSWEPVPGSRTTSWYDGVFADARDGILVGPWARLGKLRGDKFSVADDLDHTDGRDILGVHVTPQKAIAAAQGGLVLTSVTGGAKWGFAKLNLPPEVQSCLDFRAISGNGKHVWIVGRPGSVVLHSSDAGQTWDLQKTGCSLPLHAVTFFNDKRGWAVGEAGTVLTTGDGGASWQMQKQGGKRAAVLVVQAHARDLPLDTIARLGAADGHLVHALRVVTPDPASAAPARSVETIRYSAAVRSAGGLSGDAQWAFSLPQHFALASREQVLDYWNRRHARQAPQELLRQLVLAIRVWRPSVVIGDHPQAKDAATSLVAEALQEAVRQAGDAKAFPEQLETLGLSAWQASKVYAACDDSNATVVRDNDDVLEALQLSPRDHAAWAATLLPDGSGVIAGKRGYRLTQTQANDADAAGDLMQGVAVAVGEARRKVEPAAANAELVKALREANKLAHGIAVAEKADDANWQMNKLMQVLDSLPDGHAAGLLSSIARQQLQSGNGNWAHDTFTRLVERYPAHPLSLPAYRWLVQHDGSSEMRRRCELNQYVMRGKLAREVKTGDTQQVGYTDKPIGARWWQSSIDHGKKLAGFGPLYAADPSTMFGLQAARRGLGDVAGPADWFGKFQSYVKDRPWHDAAHAEQWLAGRTNEPPRRLARCRLTDMRPYLDGELDDRCWQGMKPLVLENAVGDTAKEYATQAMFAYDQEFLYLALKCRHPKGKQVPPVKVRPRDADLDAFDRVSILIDVDRDYATYFRLEIDQRGCVREDCWGEAGWNPKWFVAIKSSEESWQIEAAIPLGELTGDRIAVNSAWAFNVVRIVPGQGVQSWSQPADVQPRPEGMSLLVFQQEPGRAAAPPMPKAP